MAALLNMINETVATGPNGNAVIAIKPFSFKFNMSIPMTECYTFVLMLPLSIRSPITPGNSRVYFYIHFSNSSYF